MSIVARFNFIGELQLPKEDSKRPFCKTFTKNKKEMISINFGIKESNNNIAFVEAFDSERDVIQTMNIENEKIEIDWKDRNNEEIINKVANYKKFTVDLGSEYGGRKEFVSQFDALMYLQDELPKFKGRVCAVGQFVREFYKDKYYDKFKFTSVYAADNDAKSKLGITVDLYYNKDSIDKAEFSEFKKIYINGHILQYINKDEGSKYVPLQVILNTSKYNLDDENHKKLYDYRMSYVDIKNKTLAHILWECRLLRGVEEKPFDETMLTNKQKEQVELGIKVLEDFRPRGDILGNRINEIRLLEPKLVGEFADGIVDTEMKPSEFEEQIYVPAKEEKLKDVVSVIKSEFNSATNKVDEDDLF